MKNLFLALAAIIFVTATAQATSLHPDTFRHYRLSAVESPLINSAIHGGNRTTRMEVQANGNVELTVFKGARKEFGPVVVKTLANEEMATIETLITAAATGETKHWTGPVCLAISTRTRSVTADDGKVFVRSGAFPCGAPTYNDSKAATELSTIATTLLHEALSALN